MDKRIKGLDDQLPYLPEPIIHHIFSLLPFKQLAKTSVLSKAWLRSWCLNPNLDYNEADFSNLRKFSKFLNTTLLRYGQERIPIQKLRLRITSGGSISKLAPLVENCVETAVQNHVEEVELHVEPRVFMGGYPLFQKISASKSLSVLKICGCRSVEKAISDSVHFDSLKELSLKRISVKEEMIRSLIRSCPYIEKICLKECTGLRKLKLDNLHGMKIVEVSGIREVETNAPNLRSFTYKVRGIPCEFNITGQDLRDLSLSWLSITSDFFDDLMIKFPVLENLRLAHCDEIETINMVGHSLKNLTLKECGNLSAINLWNHSPKNLVLNECGNLRAINIASHRLETIILNECDGLEVGRLDAPNLLFFDCKGSRVPSVPLSTIPRQWHANLVYDWLKPLWFLDLRKFLNDLKGDGFLSFLTKNWNGNSFHPEEFGKIPIPPVQEIELLELAVWPLPSRETLVDALLWSCHPKTISVKSGTSGCNNLIMDLCDLLVERKGDPDCCIDRSDDIKCWRHYLKNGEIAINGVEGVEPGTFLDSLASLEPQPVYFVLKW